MNDIWLYFIPYTLLAFFILAVIQLIRKGRTRTLALNFFSLIVYELFLFYGAVNSHGWDGLIWLLVGFSIGAIHIFILFIYAMAVNHKVHAQELRTARLKDAQRRIAQQPQSVDPFFQPQPQPKQIPTQPTENKSIQSFDDFFDDNEDGELAFD